MVQQPNKDRTTTPPTRKEAAELVKKAKSEYKKGTLFISPFFPDAEFKSTGDIAGYSFAKTTKPHFINMWVYDGGPGMPQSNVPVYLDGKWGEVITVNRDLYQELRMMGLSHENCNNVLNWIKTL